MCCLWPEIPWTLWLICQRVGGGEGSIQSKKRNQNILLYSICMGWHHVPIGMGHLKTVVLQCTPGACDMTVLLQPWPIWVTREPSGATVRGAALIKDASKSALVAGKLTSKLGIPATKCHPSAPPSPKTSIVLKPGRICTVISNAAVRVVFSLLILYYCPSGRALCVPLGGGSRPPKIRGHCDRCD